MRQPVTHAFRYQKRVIDDHRLHMLFDPAPAPEVGTPRRQRQETVKRRVFSMSLDCRSTDFPAERSAGDPARQR